ncbi:xanthine dehydrogenase family protein molybdopterin-binding subunit [Cognatishimia activa]|uniref:Isoquinoline 1-oxidoreductase subunit beta n=1 Tax=Cognatishimia activa TaxID=1715691 RepID=A0A0P1IS84_9RHOB|nr:molybdopterin cofactor-binding domain-containing protein [Cognatishimia activa]CUI61951.1 Isoquinoline 1-oxidoreductase subunit beta [Cognatishimia activa]CUK26316.1 Isoquinoline 1-oxidoreductase subunit beta [Cognatishimia activa]
MGRARTIGRRSFLIGSAAIAGGVAFGVYTARTPFANPNLKELQQGTASFNPWVIVDSDKVTLIATHADKGQGIFSAQAALIAEELDIDLDQVEVSFGMPDKAYFNGAAIDAMAGFPLYDNSPTAERVRGFLGGVVKLALPMMATGGSSAIPDTYEKLRHAGACARETLKLAASQQSGVPVGQLKTERGSVILPDGTALSYTSLAGIAATIEPVEKVALRDPKDWKLAGKPMNRVDMVQKCTGTLDYGIDFETEDMVYAAIKVNPRQGGAMNSYDASAAKEMKGVKDVLEITGGVAVIADNTWRAIQASNAIEFDWGEAPYPAEQADHWKVLEETFTEESLNAEARVEGDVDAAEGEEVTGEYRSPYIAHAPLEPLNATILVTDERVDIWTGHQIQMFVESIVAGITGVDQENVHLHNKFMGGSFGHRLEFDFIKQAAEIANQMRGTPVKMTYSREEDFAHDFPRHITMGRGVAKHKDGKVTSLDVQIAGQSVMRSQMGRMGMSLPGPDAQLHEGAWDAPNFNLPNLRVRSYLTEALAPVSSWRAVGAGPNVFIYETLLDEAIHAAGADPLEERIRLMGHDVSVKVLEKVGEISNWNGANLGENRGRGVAYGFSFGVPVATVVEVTNTDRGIKLDGVWVAADVGKVIDPGNLENLGQGGTVWGLGHAINCEITYSDGMAEQSNYHAHEGMRIWQCPPITFAALENSPKVRGFGEPPVPPSAPALGNAIFAATGQRIREMPFNKHIDFV